MRWVQFCNSRGGEKRRGKERCESVKKDEEPVLPKVLSQFLSREFQFLDFVPFDQDGLGVFVGKTPLEPMDRAAALRFRFNSGKIPLKSLHPPCFKQAHR